MSFVSLRNKQVSFNFLFLRSREKKSRREINKINKNHYFLRALDGVKHLKFKDREDRWRQKPHERAKIERIMYCNGRRVESKENLF